MTHLDPNANRAQLALLVAAVLFPLTFWAVCVAGTWLALT